LNQTNGKEKMKARYMFLFFILCVNTYPMYRALKILNERKVDVVVAMQEAGVRISYHMFVR
jgi:hypothetical protein